MAGGDTEMDVDPSAPEIEAQCAIASEVGESREQIIRRAIEYIKKAESHGMHPSGVWVEQHCQHT
jgi:hypothetical protein